MPFHPDLLDWQEDGSKLYHVDLGWEKNSFFWLCLFFVCNFALYAVVVHL